MFYTKKIEVWEKGESTRVNGVLQPAGPPILLYNIKVDIQPYSSAEAKMEYGFDIKTTDVIFMKVKDIDIGKHLIKYKGNSYEVKQKILWDDYMELLMERI